VTSKSPLSIVVAENLFAAVGRVRFDRVRNLRSEPADPALWIVSAELDWTHRDPADRLIASLAMRHGCDLAGTDERIADFYKPTVQ
jgi:PIN domain nuclease of toxin-antitoxin system